MSRVALSWPVSRYRVRQRGCSLTHSARTTFAPILVYWSLKKIKVVLFISPPFKMSLTICFGCLPPLLCLSPPSWFAIASRISIATKSYSIAHPCKVVFKEDGELKFKLLTCETCDFKTIEWNNLTWTSVKKQLIFFKFWNKM